MRQNTIHISQEQIAGQMDCCLELRTWLDFQIPGERLACVDTYGCQQNEADSEQLRGYLAEMGYSFTSDETKADLVILNTCAIREHAEDRVYGNVGALVHAKRSNPNQIICVCGCMAQRPQVAEKIRNSFRHVDLVFGTHVLWRFPQLLLQRFQSGKRVFETPDMSGVIAEGIPIVRQNEVKAWVSIMYGCNNYCSYCIVPYIRGRQRSREAEQIVDEVLQLVESGYKEITLLGQNVNSYGRDLEGEQDFAWLLERLAQLPGDFRLRFMTSHPKDAGNRLFSVMAAHPSKIAPALHLPFQSGSSRVLEAMNRGYTREHYLDLVRAVREKIPHIVLTSDVIVGFPGETLEEFEQTLSLVKAVEFDSLFTFIFSSREGTPAADMPDPMPKEEKTKNFQRLLDVQNEISARKHQSYVGKTLLCLLDGQDEKGNLTGRTEGGRLVHIAGNDAHDGQWREVTITRASTWALYGELKGEAK